MRLLLNIDHAGQESHAEYFFHCIAPDGQTPVSPLRNPVANKAALWDLLHRVNPVLTPSDAEDGEQFASVWEMLERDLDQWGRTSVAVEPDDAGRTRLQIHMAGDDTR